MRVKKAFFLLFFYNVLYLFLIFFNIKSFEIWSQITDATSSGSSFFSSFNTINSHSIRIALIFPIIYLSSIINIDYNLLFSLVCLGNINIVFIIVREISKLLKAHNHYNDFFYINSLFIISFFMNGRLTFSFIGISLLILGLIKINKINKNLIIYLTLILIGFVFSSVSSGTQLVYLIIIIFYFFIRITSYLPKIKNVNIIIILIGAFALYYFKNIIYVSINKNLSFYNNNLFDMLNHGFGKYIDINQFFLIVVPFLLLIIYYFINNIKSIINSKKKLIYTTVIVSCSFGGLFGFSAFVFGLPIFLLIANDFMFNLNENLKS